MVHLRRKFGPRNPAAHWNRQIVNLRQRSGEEVEKYSDRFVDALTQLKAAQGGNLPEQTVVTWYHENLRPELQEEVERDQPADLLTAIASAEKTERIRLRKGGRWGASVNTVTQPTQFTQPTQSSTDIAIQRLAAQQGQLLQTLQGVVNQQAQLIQKLSGSQASFVQQVRTGDKL
eukprot:m.300901 g.300901  ORF g.300901 m.300901 type:complete len:175 (+) comp40803_c0_seq7:9389-9913(+)